MAAPQPSHPPPNPAAPATGPLPVNPPPPGVMPHPQPQPMMPYPVYVPIGGDPQAAAFAAGVPPGTPINVIYYNPNVPGVFPPGVVPTPSAPPMMPNGAYYGAPQPQMYVPPVPTTVTHVHVTSPAPPPQTGPRKVALFNLASQKYLTAEHNTLTCHGELNHVSHLEALFLGGGNRVHKGHFYIEDHEGGKYQTLRTAFGKWVGCNNWGLIQMTDKQHAHEAKWHIQSHPEHNGQITIRSESDRFLGIRSGKVVAHERKGHDLHELFQVETIHG